MSQLTHTLVAGMLPFGTSTSSSSPIRYSISHESSLDSIHGASGSWCVQGNVCAALANCALSDEALDRIVKVDDVIAACVCLLEQGVDWPAGHAARAIGNFAASQEACMRMHSTVGFLSVVLFLLLV